MNERLRLSINIWYDVCFSNSVNQSSDSSWKQHTRKISDGESWDHQRGHRVHPRSWRGPCHMCSHFQVTLCHMCSPTIIPDNCRFWYATAICIISLLKHLLTETKICCRITKVSLLLFTINQLLAFTSLYYLLLI